jgi:hypothetical protein
MTAVCVPMPGRLATYRVVIPHVDIVVGFVRLDVCARKWIARTCGSEKTAAQIRRFETREQAASWLREREPAPRVPA